MGIDYQVGDATQPHGEGVKVIVHVCNVSVQAGCILGNEVIAGKMGG